MKTTLRAVMAIGLAGLTVVVAAGAKPLPAAAPARTNWNAAVVRTDRDSYVLGKPDAPVKLVEFISYTCPHCADFERESTDQLRIGMIAPGKGTVEIRAFVRDPVDMTASVLARCGPTEKFFGNHAAFLRGQERWIGPMVNPSPAQQDRWYGSAPLATRMRHIATDFGFYAIMAGRGYDRTAVDRCLGDTALADRLARQTQDADERGYVHGTPSFMLNGIVLTGTSDWRMLKPQVEARLP